MFSSWLSTFAQRETMFGISPPRSTPSANARAPAAPQNVSVSGATKNSPSAVKPCVSTCAWLPCQTAVARSRVALARAEHLREHERREVVDDLDRPHGRDRDRRRPDAVHDRPLGRDQPDRPRHALVPGHVPGEQREDRREEAAPGRPVGAVDAELDLRARAGEVVREGVALLDRGQLDLRVRAGHVDVLAHAPLAVRAAPRAGCGRAARTARISSSETASTTSTP